MVIRVDASPRAAGLGSLGASLVPSALSVRLAEHRDAERAFLAARHHFVAGDRIDMGPLAAELGVDRTSLFRWVGNRDALLTEVLWSLAAPTFDAADAELLHSDQHAHGADRVEVVLTRFVAALIEADYFRAFLEREPGRALRLLTTRSSQVQRRFIAVLETLLTDEIAAGRMRSPLPVHDLAYVLVRVAESFTYADLIAGEPPSAERAKRAFALVLNQTRLEQHQLDPA